MCQSLGSTARELTHLPARTCSHFVQASSLTPLATTTISVSLICKSHQQPPDYVPNLQISMRELSPRHGQVIFLTDPQTQHIYIYKPELNFHYESTLTACYRLQWPRSLATQQPKPGFWIKPLSLSQCVFWVSWITSPWFLSHYFISPHPFWQPDAAHPTLQSWRSLDHSLCKGYLPGFKF